MDPDNISAEAILERYTQPHWDEPLPDLSDQETEAVAAYFDERDIVLRASFRGNFGESKLTLATMVHRDLDMSLDRIPGSFLGPYIEQGKFKPNSAGVWAVKEAAGDTEVA